MTRYFTAPDGADEPTIWEDMQHNRAAAVVVRKAELPGPCANLLWRVLTGVLTADDETVERVARRTYAAGWGEGESGWDTLRPFQQDFWRRVALATLAALREGR